MEIDPMTKLNDLLPIGNFLMLVNHKVQSQWKDCKLFM